MTTSSELQIRFLNRVKDRVSVQQSVVFELAELLKISTDSVYRRLRGETPLTLDEIALICDRFKLTFDVTSQNIEGKVTFNYSTLTDFEGFRSFLQYYNQILTDIARDPKHKFIYAAIDVPIFHYFSYPELAAFKMFYWMREVMVLPSLSERKFDLAQSGTELKEIGKQVYDSYCNVNSIEIWTYETIVGLIKQVDFYLESGLFASLDDARLVCDQLTTMLSNLEKQAEWSSKKGMNTKVDEPNFQLYLCDIEIGNNCVYFEKDLQAQVYMGFLTFNSMATSNEHYCKITHEWINNILKKSTLISGIAQKQRYQFFKQINAKVEELKKRI